MAVGCRCYQWDGWSKLVFLMSVPLMALLLMMGILAAQANGDVGKPGLEMLKFLGIAFGSFIVELLVGPWVYAFRTTLTYERSLFMNRKLKMYWFKVLPIPRE